MKTKGTVILFGDKTDPAVRASAAKLRQQGRKVEFIKRPPFDTGTGPCGNFLCDCTTSCQANDAMDMSRIFGIKKSDFQL